MLTSQAAEEEMNMNAPKTGTQSKIQATYQEIIKVEEQIEMKSMIAKIKTVSSLQSRE